MGEPLGAVCVCCGTAYPLGLDFEGCPKCATDHFRSNLTPVYDYRKIPESVFAGRLPEGDYSLWRYHPLLPVGRDAAVSLGEGGTPLLRIRRVGEDLGCPALWLKDESRNPTGSFKDRFCAVAVSKAARAGARSVAVASTGNQGVSLAAYAAAAGLGCVVLTLETLPEPLRVAMEIMGAHVVAVPTPADRWKVLREGVEREGWFPVSNYLSPPAGSNYYGIEGYKTIAYEIWEQLGRKAPRAVAVPTCYGDGLYGIWKGFCELKTMGLIEEPPRMIAAEISGWLTRSLGEGKPWEGESVVRSSAAFNLLTSRSTWQALAALRESRGEAVHVGEEAILSMQQALARREGIYGEASGVAALAALGDLAGKGQAREAGEVVAVLTSGGMKDPATTARTLPPLRRAEPTLKAVMGAIP